MKFGGLDPNDINGQDVLVVVIIAKVGLSPKTIKVELNPRTPKRKPSGLIAKESNYAEFSIPSSQSSGYWVQLS